MSDQNIILPNHDLASHYEEVAAAFGYLFERQEWRIVHMGGQYMMTRVILTEKQFEEFKALLNECNHLHERVMGALDSFADQESGEIE